ncbi:MAG: hypothetical protein GY874_01290 [Desulfobacteraceae bacterium]|nr:hypothetical protein [Desulfobacteraceae bacterium]
MTSPEGTALSPAGPSSVGAVADGSDRGVAVAPIVGSSQHEIDLINSNEY